MATMLPALDFAIVPLLDWVPVLPVAKAFATALAAPGQWTPITTIVF
jgi:hypothetical protein